ncbi:MAG: hypothetical protein M3131_00020 [Actinomycetota bacterium]|nr:hypothetical protein [Actinomycetota bacterium]
MGHAATRPPVDVVLADGSNGRALRVWHEGGEQAATLLSVLNEDLTALAVDDFLEKWDVPPL